MKKKGAQNAGWHAILLERSKLSYQESAPPVTTSTSQIPHTIMSLHDLCPLILQPSHAAWRKDDEVAAGHAAA